MLVGSAVMHIALDFGLLLEALRALARELSRREFVRATGRVFQQANEANLRHREVSGGQGIPRAGLCAFGRHVNPSGRCLEAYAHSAAFAV